jgi:hypothetical protein
MLSRRRWTILTLLFAICAHASPPNPAKIYTDRTSGLTLTYPSNWTLTHSMTDAPALLFDVGDRSQASQVTVLSEEKTYIAAPVNSYSDHTQGTFIFRVLSDVTGEKCYAVVSSFGHDQRRPAWTTLHGTRFLKLEIAYAALGTADGHTLYATFRSGKCYLFEGLILSWHTDEELPPDFKPDPPNLLADQMDQIMQSVRISSPVQPTK